MVIRHYSRSTSRTHGIVGAQPVAANHAPQKVNQGHLLAGPTHSSRHPAKDAGVVLH